MCREDKGNNTASLETEAIWALSLIQVLSWIQFCFVLFLNALLFLFFLLDFIFYLF